MKYKFWKIVLPLVLFAAHCFGQAVDSVMPIGFKTVHLGMTWETLLSIRTNALVSNMMPDVGESLVPDPQKPKGGLVETFTVGQPYSKALYAFENGILVAVMFGKEIQSDQGERQLFLKDVVSNYGNPTLIQSLREQREQSALRWDKGDIQINAILPSVRSSTKYGLVLQIMDLKYAERIKAIDVSNNAEKDMFPQGADMQQSETLQSEVNGLLSVPGSVP